MDSAEVRLNKAIHLIAEIEELATHIEDADVMRRWVIKLAQSRHAGLLNVRFARVVQNPLTQDSVADFKTKLDQWKTSFASFISRMMIEKRTMTDEQVRSAFAEWEKENPMPSLHP